jgi:hypothetical protein
MGKPKKKKAKNFLNKDQRTALAKEAKKLDLEPTADGDKKAARTLSKKLGFRVSAGNVKGVRLNVLKKAAYRKNGKKKVAKKAKKKTRKKSAYAGSTANLANLKKARKKAAAARKKSKVPTVAAAKAAIAGLQKKAPDGLGALKAQINEVSRKVDVIYRALGL